MLSVQVKQAEGLIEALRAQCLIGTTLHDAIQIAVKYHRTAGPLFDLSFEFAADQLVIGARNALHLEVPLLTLLTEELFSGFPLLLELLTGRPVAPLAVELG